MWRMPLCDGQRRLQLLLMAEKRIRGTRMCSLKLGNAFCCTIGSCRYAGLCPVFTLTSMVDLYASRPTTAIDQTCSNASGVAGMDVAEIKSVLLEWM